VADEAKDCRHAGHCGARRPLGCRGVLARAPWPAGSGGVATIDIQFNIKHGRATKITRLELNNIPASCVGFPSTAVSYSFPHHIFISRIGRFHATDVVNGGRVTYMVRGHFITRRKAAGKLRIDGTVPGCRSADTGLVSWTATATH
jgi:hypothetical protein